MVEAIDRATNFTYLKFCDVQKPSGSKDPAIYVRLPFQQVYASAINESLDTLRKNIKFRRNLHMFIDDKAVGVKVAWHFSMLALASIIRKL